MSTAWDETVDQNQAPEPFPVHVASINGSLTRNATPEYGTCMTWNVDTITNMGQPMQILTRRYRRHKARIIIEGLGGTSFSNTGQVATPGAGAIIASVTGLPADEYTISWQIRNQVAGATANNYGLYVNGVLVETADYAAASTALAIQLPMTEQLPAGSTVSVQAIGADGTGTYSAQLVVAGAVDTTQIVLNSRRDALTSPTAPQGLIFSASRELEWDSQQPCWAVVLGIGPIAVKVLDESFEET